MPSLIFSWSKLHCIPTASCRHLFLRDFRDYIISLLFLWEPNFVKIHKNHILFAPKKSRLLLEGAGILHLRETWIPPMLKTMKKTELCAVFCLKQSPNPSWTLSSSFFVWRFRSLRLKLLPCLFSWAYHSVPVPWPNSLVLSAKVKWPRTTIPSYNHLVELFPELRGYDFWMVHKKWWEKKKC